MLRYKEVLPTLMEQLYHLRVTIIRLGTLGWLRFPYVFCDVGTDVRVLMMITTRSRYLLASRGKAVGWLVPARRSRLWHALPQPSHREGWVGRPASAVSRSLLATSQTLKPNHDGPSFFSQSASASRLLDAEDSLAWSEAASMTNWPVATEGEYPPPLHVWLEQQNLAWAESGFRHRGYRTLDQLAWAKPDVKELRRCGLIRRQERSKALMALQVVRDTLSNLYGAAKRPASKGHSRLEEDHRSCKLDMWRG
jgi:hypothetical protein